MTVEVTGFVISAQVGHREYLYLTKECEWDDRSRAWVFMELPQDWKSWETKPTHFTPAYYDDRGQVKPMGHSVEWCW